MSMTLDLSWKSYNKHGEELCGDKVEILKREDSDIIVLADGMGSGVKANILATLTSRILGTMLQEGATVEDCIETVAETLPICQERKIAYATFSVLQIFHTGEVYLMEYDNPSCIMIRDGKLFDYPVTEREISGKTIRESKFSAKKSDCFVLMSDGVIFAGEGELMNLNWTRKDMADYALKCTKQTLSASRLVAKLAQVCYDLYGQMPEDDTTVAVARVTDRKTVSILTGPPASKDDDEKMIQEFMETEGQKVVCGGTSASITARVLGETVEAWGGQEDGTLPPMSKIKGIDLVTEGVLTLGKTIEILTVFLKEEFDENFFKELDGNNGAAKLTKLLIEECTELHLFVGKAENHAYSDPNLHLKLQFRKNLVEQLKECVKKMGKYVDVKYY